jgi:hypothetical protein
MEQIYKKRPQELVSERIRKVWIYAGDTCVNALLIYKR